MFHTYRKNMDILDALGAEAIKVLDPIGFYFSGKTTEKHSQHDLPSFLGDALK